MIFYKPYFFRLFIKKIGLIGSGLFCIDLVASYCFIGRVIKAFVCVRVRGFINS